MRKRVHMLLVMFLFTLGQMAVSAQENDVDRGFIHPGGLHTQADFDRVKQLIKDKNEKVMAAYNVLKSAAYSQSSVQTYPVETIVRGGSGENYINAARGATMAYQNALRWKIDGTKANADAAVRILMAWANTTTGVTGNSDAALAMGLYGYQFAQAAELMRDYEGWSREDFQKYKRWMMTVWYPGAVTFLRYRNGTWENSGKWWEAPGHYWSNWGLCNALCVASIGVLCDDVYIYNQGMSFFKYDQVGNYANPHTMHTVDAHDFDGQAIWNDGLTDFLGNLVVTDEESDLETGAYGRLGQMNESGRDTGHSAMALGLAIDLAKLGWNQGDDLFAYMDHRLASGIEYVAAQTQNVENLPWTPYLYGNNGYYYSDYRSWLMMGPALGAQMRPYWGTVIGIYESVKGVKMPYAEISYAEMGTDGGGEGSTSGGYDHLGYSVLMNTRVPQLCPADQLPTELTPKMECSAAITTLVPSPAVEQRLGNLSGRIFLHNELGGLVNKYNQIGGAVPNGRTLTLMPQLPEDEEDTGNWRWNTGEETRDITVTTDHSYIYRVTYTNSRGIESQLCFPIACESDGTPIELTPSIVYNGETLETDTLNVLYGSKVQLTANPTMGGGTWKWSSGSTAQTLTTPALTADRQYTVTYKHTSGVSSTQVFRLGVHFCEPYILVGTKRVQGSETVVASGGSATLGLVVPSSVSANQISWSNGETGETLELTNLTQSIEVEASFTLSGKTYVQRFAVFVPDAEDKLLEPGNYVVVHVPTQRLLTHHGMGEPVTFEEGNAESPRDEQVWFVNRRNSAKYALISLPDSFAISSSIRLSSSTSYSYNLSLAVGSNRLALSSGYSTRNYWIVGSEGTISTKQASTPTSFPFELVPVSDGTAIRQIVVGEMVKDKLYDLSGRQVMNPTRGLYIINGKKVIVNK